MGFTQNVLGTHFRAQITDEHRIWFSLDAIIQGTEMEDLLLEGIDLSGVVDGFRNRGGAVLKEGRGVSSKREGEPLQSRNLLFLLLPVIPRW
jgi:hypothetical protein